MTYLAEVATTKTMWECGVGREVRKRNVSLPVHKMKNKKKR